MLGNAFKHIKPGLYYQGEGMCLVMHSNIYSLDYITRGKVCAW